MRFGRTVVEVSRQSVLHADTDAIVNAANTQLRGGGGIDGAIHAAAGPQLLTYLKDHFPNGTATGIAVTSPGFQLPQKHVIHVPGPVWKGGNSGEQNALKSAYLSAIILGNEAGLSSIAFCSISTGVYAYPLTEAARVATTAVVMWLLENPNTSLDRVLFAMYGDGEYRAFCEALEELEPLSVTG